MQSAVLINHSGGSNILESIAFYARVSNPESQLAALKSDKLVHYLIEHEHWSPLEMVSATIEVNTTRDIARQLLRHRSFSFQEFSQRYASVDALGGLVTREARLQDLKNRQNSIHTEDEELKEHWVELQKAVAEVSSDVYEWALANGIAKEQARVVLPEGMTRSRLYVAGTMRSWVHYIKLRSAPGTQQEHRELAIMCADALKLEFPMIEDFVCRS